MRHIYIYICRQYVSILCRQYIYIYMYTVYIYIYTFCLYIQVKQHNDSSPSLSLSLYIYIYIHIYTYIYIYLHMYVRVAILRSQLHMAHLAPSASSGEPQAAKKAGVPYMLPTLSSYTLDEMLEARRVGSEKTRRPHVWFSKALPKWGGGPT